MNTYLTLAIVICTWPVFASAESPARMRYAEALRIAELDFTDVGGVNTQSICFSARSRNPNVSPSDIRIKLQTNAGDVSLPLDADGRFAIPVTEDLRKENPWITANQPKGSMLMEASVRLRMRVSPESHKGIWRVQYSSLFPLHNVLKQVDDVTDAISRTHEVKSTFPKPKSVTLTNEDELAKATLIVGDDEREIPSPIRGDFVIPFRAELMTLDSWVAVEPPGGWSLTPEFEPAVAEVKEAEPEYTAVIP